MKSTPDSPEDKSALTDEALDAFTLESIRPVRDFTARKTLEQAHAFATGLAGVARTAAGDDEARGLLAELARIGITPSDAELVAQQAIALMKTMADRDQKADVFHAAVKEAGQAERAMYERLASLARLLRGRLGARSPALATFGVPPDLPARTAADTAPAGGGAKPRGKASSRPIEPARAASPAAK